MGTSRPGSRSSAGVRGQSPTPLMSCQDPAKAKMKLLVSQQFGRDLPFLPCSNPPSRLGSKNNPDPWKSPEEAPDLQERPRLLLGWNKLTEHVRFRPSARISARRNHPGPPATHGRRLQESSSPSRISSAAATLTQMETRRLFWQNKGNERRPRGREVGAAARRGRRDGR